MKYKIDQIVFLPEWDYREPTIVPLVVNEVKLTREGNIYTCSEIHDYHKNNEYRQENLYETLEEARAHLMKQQMDEHMDTVKAIKAISFSKEELSPRKEES